MNMTYDEAVDLLSEKLFDDFDDGRCSNWRQYRDHSRSLLEAVGYKELQHDVDVLIRGVVALGRSTNVV